MTGQPNAGTRPGHRELARPEIERLATSATILTFVRTAGTVTLALWGARDHSLTLLSAALAAFWLGDVADGMLARMRDEETRIGAVLDILCDRISAATYYVGFAWYDPDLAVPVGIYLVEFLVLDMFLSLAFLAWPLSSPNYFYVVDRRLWRWNWSRLGKAANSGLFAVLMVATRDPWLTGGIALALVGLKAVSLLWLLRIGLPIPGAQNPRRRSRSIRYPDHQDEHRPSARVATSSPDAGRP